MVYNLSSKNSTNTKIACFIQRFPKIKFIKPENDGQIISTEVFCD